MRWKQALRLAVLLLIAGIPMLCASSNASETKIAEALQSGIVPPLSNQQANSQSPQTGISSEQPFALIDTLSIGSSASEKGHDFLANEASRIKGGMGQPALRLMPGTNQSWKGGDITCTMKVDPERQNYLTVKLWGSDKGSGHLMLFANGLQVGYRMQGDYDFLNQTDEEPEAPGRFIYETVLLPSSLTKGRTSLVLRIRAEGPIWPYGVSFAQLQKPMQEASRGIYSLYTHLNGYFVPPPGEEQGTTAPAAVRLTPGEEVIAQSKKIVIDRLAKLIAHPPTVPKLTAPQKPVEQRMLLMAQAYGTPWTPAFNNPKTLDQIVQDGDWLANNFAASPKNPGEDWMGAGPLGQAIVETWPDIKLHMEEIIQIKSIQMTRKQAWAKALRAGVDFWRTHRRLYTNQSMIVDFNIYMANRALALLAPQQALPEKQALHYVYEAMGIEPWLGCDQEEGSQAKGAVNNNGMDVPEGGVKPFGSHFYEITRKGLSRELGFVAGYGETILRFAHDISVFTGDEKIRQQLRKIQDARLYFRYPGVDVDGFRCMKLASEIDNRGAHFPLSGAAYNAPDNRENWWMDLPVLLHDDPAAVGAAQQALADNQYFANTSARLKSGDTLGMMLNVDSYEKAKELPASTYRLPMSVGQPDFVFSDEEDAVLAIKHGETRIFINLYFRAERAVNRVARILELTPELTRISTVRMQVQVDDSGENYVRPDWIVGIRGVMTNLTPPGDKVHQAWTGEVMPIAKRLSDAVLPKYGDWGPFVGKAAFYQLRYGDYLIGLNTTEDRSYNLKSPDGIGRATDLVSGKEIPCSGEVPVAPLSTVVLYLGR